MDRAFQRCRPLMLRGTFYSVPPTDEYKAYLDVEFGVYPWIVRDQDADLE